MSRLWMSSPAVIIVHDRHLVVDLRLFPVESVYSARQRNLLPQSSCIQSPLDIDSSPRLVPFLLFAAHALLHLPTRSHCSLPPWSYCIRSARWSSISISTVIHLVPIVPYHLDLAPPTTPVISIQMIQPTRSKTLSPYRIQPPSTFLYQLHWSLLIELTRDASNALIRHVLFQNATTPICSFSWED